MKIIVRMGMAGNGVPAFIIAQTRRDLERPFGAAWDAERHLWLYPAYYPSARKVLKDFSTLSKRADDPIDFEFSDSASQYIQKLDETERRYRAQELPEGFSFVTKPFEHQLLGLAHVFYLLRSALFYDPGLGKSKIAIDLIRLQHFLGKREPTVILGPLVTVRNWGAELDRHSGGQLRWGAMLGTPKEKAAIVERAGAGEFDVLILTYDTNVKFVDQINAKVDYKTVIADESHLIKTWKSQRTKAAYELGQKAVRKVIMTGTPTLGSPLDLFGQYKFLADAFMPEGYVAYQRRFVETRGPNSHVVLGYKNLDILNARTQFVALRRTKAECLDLPERTIIDIEYDLSRHQKVVYNQLVEEMKIDLELLVAQLGGMANDALPPETELPNRAVMLAKLLQLCSGFLVKNPDTKLCDKAEIGGCRHMMNCVAARITPYTSGCKVAPELPDDVVTVFDENPKLDALLELLESILANPTNKVIVWAYFSREMDILEEKITALGVKVTRVDGRTGQRIQEKVDTFNSDPTQRVYLAQVSTGVGITINSASYTIYYSLPYSLGSYLQSLDRNYRIGQKNQVTVYRLLGRQTIEPSIVKLLDNKVDVDHVLTQKLNCIVCPRSLACIADNVSLFDPDCIHKRAMGRPVTKALRVL